MDEAIAKKEETAKDSQDDVDNESQAESSEKPLTTESTIEKEVEIEEFLSEEVKGVCKDIIPAYQHIIIKNNMIKIIKIKY